MLTTKCIVKFVILKGRYFCICLCSCVYNIPGITPGTGNYLKYCLNKVDAVNIFGHVEKLLTSKAEQRWSIKNASICNKHGIKLLLYSSTAASQTRKQAGNFVTALRKHKIKVPYAEIRSLKKASSSCHINRRKDFPQQQTSCPPSPTPTTRTYSHQNWELKSERLLLSSL